VARPWPALLLLAALGVLALVRPGTARTPPPALPAAACMPWMADALPGIGRARREETAARIRAGEVPAAARTWFSR
jgi:hypothetical protein